MRILTTLLVFGVIAYLAARSAPRQDLPGSRAMPGNEAPAGPYIFYWGPYVNVPPEGRPENQWRYRLYDDRWWYWTTDNTWSFYNGDIWVPYSADRDRELSRAPLLGPISGNFAGHGVWTRGNKAGLTMIPGDHAAAPHLKRGTVLPRYLEQQPLPGGVDEAPSID
ncbi:MAG TPA: hypothetical protein VFI31_10735 [Pirellulales bacterium]|nr:hypothetical protein [Pirellulales bacterium]